MKTIKIILTIALILLVHNAFAQGINYKAIVKDGSGTIIANQNITVQFTVLQGVSQTTVYRETHSPTTDANGIIIINIGEGSPISGVFNNINWGSDQHFLKTEMNTGSGFVDMGTTEFKTVPYALSAKNVVETDPVFSAWDKSTGISITENQISDLTHTVNTDDQDAIEVQMTGYVKPGVSGSITGSDSVDSAIGKLEKGLEDATAGGGDVNVQSDWNQSNTGSDDFINNKPTIPTNNNELTNGAGFVTENTQLSDSEIETMGFVKGAHTVNTDDQNAGEVVNTPSGNLTSTNVQAALNELQTELNAAGGTDDQDAGEVQMTGYVKPGVGGSITGSDSVDSAIGKLEKGLEDATAGGGDVNVQSDWNQSNTGSDDFINNKPTIPTNNNELTNGAGFVTENTQLSDAEIETMGFVKGEHTVNTDNQNASEVANTPSGNLTSTNVQAALNELQTELNAAGGTDDQTATEVSYSNTTSGLAATNVQTAIDELQASSGGSGAFSTTNNITSNALGNIEIDDFVFGSTQLNNDTGTTNDDNRMFFDKSKGAFRAGNVNGDQWDDANIGVSSGAFGRSIASGSNSFAAGLANATGNWSTAFGASTASGSNGAVAFGNSSLASGSVSFAAGVSVEASGSDAIAMGRLCTSSNQGTVAIGYQANSSGLHAFSYGYQVNSTGAYSMVLGKESSSEGFESIAIGSEVSATNTYTMAFGRNSIASAYNSYTLGFGLKSEAGYNLAIGRYNIGGGSTNLHWVETDPLFEIGNGTDDITRRNALTVLKNGTISAPSLTNSLIDIAGNKALITKEYADANYSTGGTTVTINDLVDAKTEYDDFYSSMFFGLNSGLNDDGGNGNLGIGFQALESNTSGHSNIAIGHHNQWRNTTGIDNVSIGPRALENNVSGSHNIAIGATALPANTTGYDNVAIGYNTMWRNSTGYHNTAVGQQSLSGMTTGWDNTAVGYYALLENNGYYNTAVGKEALRNNTSGYRNVALGFDAMSYNTTGSNNIAIGSHAQVPNNTGDYQVRIGSNGITYAGIQVPWTITSDKVWKENIRTLPYGLDLVMQLKPVDYIRKNNKKQTREMGFIAQDVEKLLSKIGYYDQGVLTKDDDGHLSLRYNDLISLLTKAIQEQQEIIDGQNIKINTLVTELDDKDDVLSTLDKRIKQIEDKLNIRETFNTVQK